MNHLQKLYEASKLVYDLIAIYAENFSHHYNHQQNLIKLSKLLQYHFFIPDFNLLICELDNFKFKVLY